MYFTMEALKAKKGDSLLIHVGTRQSPTLLVVDGGPSGVYRRSLKKRLHALRDERAPGGSLPIRLLMVSHIDDDHIKGILDLTRELREQKADQALPSFEIAGLWHNSFDDVVGNHVDAFVEAAHGQLGPAAVSGEFVPDLALANPEAAMVVASVPQGRQLRDDARLLGLSVNAPFDSVVASAAGAVVDPPIADGLDVVVLGPNPERVRAFQQEWDRELRRRGLDRPEDVDVAAYLDRSVWNLASIVVLLRAHGKEMLLTGDGRGDYILEGLEEAGLLRDGRRHIDLLKLPHHGSSNNVELGFFQRVTADHYVISGDGSHGNPNVETLRMIFDSRRGDDRSFTIHLTYPPEQFRAYRGDAYPLEEWNALVAEQVALGRPFRIAAPKEGQLSVNIDLLDPIE